MIAKNTITTNQSGTSGTSFRSFQNGLAHHDAHDDETHGCPHEDDSLRVG